MKLTKRQQTDADQKALLYGVVFNGLQEMAGGKPPKYTWTDYVTGGTIYTASIAQLPRAVVAARRKFKGAQHPVANRSGNVKQSQVLSAEQLSAAFYGMPPRFERKMNIDWPTALTALGHCARLDYLSDKYDEKYRVYYHEFEQFPELYAAPQPMSDGRRMLIAIGKFKLRPEGITG